MGVIYRMTTGWRAPAVLAGGGMAAVAVALFMQHVVGVQPCVLCVYQRWPYVIIVLLGLTALVFGRDRRFRAGVLTAAGAVMLVGAGVALFHVGIQQHWWQAVTGCGVPPAAASVEELRASLMAGPVVRCDVVSWSLLGISLAGYNIPLSLTMAGFAFVAARRVGKPRVQVDAVSSDQRRESAD